MVCAASLIRAVAPPRALGSVMPDFSDHSSSYFEPKVRSYACEKVSLLDGFDPDGGLLCKYELPGGRRQGSRRSGRRVLHEPQRAVHWRRRFDAGNLVAR